MQVISALAMGGGLTFVQMREVAPLDPILSFDSTAPSEVHCFLPRLHFRPPHAATCARYRPTRRPQPPPCAS